MSHSTLPDWIAQQDWIEPAEEAVQRTAQSVFESENETVRTVEDVLHGVWLGDPLHASLTDVPIGSWTAAVVMDAVETVSGNHKLAAGADAAIGIGLVGAVAAAVTGWADWQHTVDAPRRIGLVHGLLNLSGAGLFATSLILRRRNARGLGKAVAAGGYAVMVLAARLGGELVYRHKIGTDHGPGDAGPTEFTDVVAVADLAEDQPRRFDVNDVPVVLVKSSDRVFALAEHCAHLGGPLSEGECRNGVIQCPWHRSQFSIATGEIVHGPSVYPQVTFETRVVDGRVQIRRQIGPPQARPGGRQAA